MASFSLRASLLAFGFALSTTAQAAAPVFPGASGVGLEPPPGMTPAKTFNGFRGGAASIVITELPKQAYAQIDHSRDMFVTHLAAKHADDVEVGGVHGFEVVGADRVRSETYRKWVLILDGKDETALVSVQIPASDQAISDAEVESALRSVVFRPRPGLDQQVAALPFAVGDLAGFRISAAALGAAAILVDGPKDVDPNQSQAHIVVSASEATPPKADRAGFAKTQLQDFQAVRTVKIDAAKTFDADGVEWAEVDAEGSEGPQETPVAITYFVRFDDPSGLISVVCIAPQAEAARYAARFKSVALSVKPKG